MAIATVARIRLSEKVISCIQLQIPPDSGFGDTRTKPEDWDKRADSVLCLTIFTTRVRATDRGGEHVSNITPDRGSRIGCWSKTELAYFLNTGANPQGDYAGSLMVEIIDDGLRYLNDANLDAIATYVLALRPVSNPLAHDKRNKRRPDEFGY